PLGPAAAERLVEQNEIGSALESRREQRLLRGVQVALRDERREVALDAGAVAHLREAVGVLRGAQQRLLRTELLVERAARDERIRHLAERFLNGALVARDLGALAHFGEI